MQRFDTSLEHLLAELERIDLLVRAGVARAPQAAADEQFRGLYISEAEVDRLLQPAADGPGPGAPPAVPPADAQALEKLAAQIAQRRQGSRDAGVVLLLDRLCDLFGLAAPDLDILLITLAGELESRYDRLYAYLQDDVTRKWPSVDLVTRLLATPVHDRIALRARLAPMAPLRRHRLVELVADPAQPVATTLSQAVRADRRIVGYLLGFTDPDERIARFAALSDASRPGDLDGVEVDPDALWRALAGGTGKAGVLYLRGPWGAGKQRVAEALCREQGRRLLVVDLARLAAQTELPFGDALALLAREARLQHAAPYWSGFDLLLAAANRVLLGEFLRMLEDAQGLVFLSGEAPWAPAERLRGLPYRSVAIPRPGIAGRAAGWRSALAAYPCAVGADQLAELAARFRFTRGQIDDAAASAMGLACQRQPQAPRIGLPELYEACRTHSNQALRALARHVTPRFSWPDIVLSPDRLVQLREICNHMKYRDRVYREWGFERKLGLGKGLAVLFAGPSGTGKTMSAEIIANELGVDLYKIDLSSVISKYLGETEKNLALLFAEAETSNAILFFDEADALFGKRSEVRDSHDRYANIEVGYLLQRMEDYEGIAILATNFRKNMDEAFVRRLHFTVEFPFPGHEERLRIWENIWPDAAPRDPGLDLAAIARQFELTGGNIRNIALCAAFLAADAGVAIGMQHILAATQREYQKMGKLMTESVFRANAAR